MAIPKAVSVTDKVLETAVGKLDLFKMKFWFKFIKFRSISMAKRC